MTYYKQTVDGYITTIGTSDSTASGEITEAEYNGIAARLVEKPEEPTGKIYRLTMALAWELADEPETVSETLYTQEELEQLTNAELEVILSGYGVSVRMNKANLIRLILSLQGQITQ